MHNSNYDDVVSFHRKFAVPVREVPTLLAAPEFEFRLKFLREEVEEFREAHNKGNLVEAADALLDLAYVVFGTAAMMGVPWQKCWNHVHYANMLKMRASADASNSKRGSALDVIKPVGWVAPDMMIAIELQHQGWVIPKAMLIDRVTGKTELLNID